MLKYLHKARSKKGFTLVELVIVIAIIAIMSAVAIPNAIAYNRRAEGRSSNSHATSFYFALQQTFLNVMDYDNSPMEFTWDTKTRDDAAISGKYFYIRYEKTGEKLEMKLDGGGNETALANVTSFNFIKGQLTQFMKSAEIDGYYYAMVDSDLRVVVAYHSKFQNLTNGTSVGIKNANMTNDGFIFGAFPILNSLQGTVTGFNGDGGDVTQNVTAWYGASAIALQDTTDKYTTKVAQNRAA
ncbi:MAG: prepilin-type N-terminal cleavage/methylation domain-containing protein [Oscillospiraceae bacterium]|nr:prepilin-type N-terminal cleavage/methylation domain-containing protein [Oscillospiraceae bacterium]